MLLLKKQAGLARFFFFFVHIIEINIPEKVVLSTMFSWVLLFVFNYFVRAKSNIGLLVTLKVISLKIAR